MFLRRLYNRGYTNAGKAESTTQRVDDKHRDTHNIVNTEGELSDAHVVNAAARSTDVVSADAQQRGNVSRGFNSVSLKSGQFTDDSSHLKKVDSAQRTSTDTEKRCDEQYLGKTICTHEKKYLAVKKQRDVVLPHGLHQESLLLDTTKELDVKKEQFHLVSRKLASQEDVIADLQRTLQAKDINLGRKENLIGKLDRDVKFAHGLLQAEQTACEALRSDLRVKNLQLEQQNVGIEQLEADIKDSNESLGEQRAKCGILQDELEARNKVLEGKDDEIASLYKGREFLVNGRAHFKKEAEELEEEVKVLAEKTEELQSQLADKEQELLKQKSDNTGFRKERKKLLKERGAFRKQAESLGSENHFLLNEGMQPLRDEIETLKNMIYYKETELKEVHKRDRLTIDKLRDERDKLAELNNQFHAYFRHHGNGLQSAIVTRIQSLEGEVQSLRKENHYRKSDVQNLLIGIQQQEGLWQDVNKRNEELRLERQTVQNELTSLQTKNDRNESMILEITKTFDMELDGFDNAVDELAHFLVSTKGPTSTKSKDLVVAHIGAKYALKERLDKRIAALEVENSALTTKINKAESELDKKLFEEVTLTRQADLLEKKAENLEAIIATQKQQIDRFDAIAQENSLANNPLGCSPVLYQDMERKLRPLEEEFKRLRVQIEPLVKAHLELQDKYHIDTRQLALEKANWERLATQYVDLYYDEAITKNEHLHKELAKFKRLAGKPHTAPPSYPFNKLIHERKMAAQALKIRAQGDESDDLRGVLTWLREWDSEDTMAWHGATALAMKKIMPELWYVHQLLGKVWIPPTVPILTEMGLLGTYADDGEAMAARIEVIWKELQAINERDPGYTDKESDSDNESLRAQSLAESEAGNHQEEGRSILDGIPTMSADYDESAEYQDLHGDGRPAWFHERSAQIDEMHAKAVAERKAFEMGMVDI
jgi:chromosome segregation ATPase